ncbi:MULTISPECIES: acetylating acetaldehyde dehydrogenase [unclassified Micromonospora]|uniref:acetylating acetaldehyde dehydrogenase n=1 Tax=unclassified Micromonospora TaxID=2617518 RepID=UPI00362D6A31
MNHHDSRKAAGRLSVAVLGAGLIGVDLVTKVIRSDHLDMRLVVGRDEATKGLRQVARLGVPVAADGIQSLVESDRPFDVVFDATSAAYHAEHAEKLLPFGTLLVDLTPSRVGQMVFPTVNRADIGSYRDLSMVSCGGQTSVPILHAIAKTHDIEYIEVVTTAATLSIGHGTRVNLDEYVDTTAEAVRTFTGVRDVKALVNISPAKPSPTFRVSMALLGRNLTTESLREAVTGAADGIRAFAGGYEVKACTVNDGQGFVAVEVTSSGDQIPRFAGNLDIINSAAIRVAEHYAADRLSMAGVEHS